MPLAVVWDLRSNISTRVTHFEVANLERRDGTKNAFNVIIKHKGYKNSLSTSNFPKAQAARSFHRRTTVPNVINGLDESCETFP
jgi:hypothetical protein